MKNSSIYWFRRDLRLDDNRGLYEALQNGASVLPLFIFDTDIIGKLPNRDDSRVTFIRKTLIRLKDSLPRGKNILVAYGKPSEILNYLLSNFDFQSIFANEDYEPEAVRRDREISNICHKAGKSFNTYKDQVIFAPTEILKSDNSPYTFYTPYSKKWIELLNTNKNKYLKEYDSSSYLDRFIDESKIKEIAKSSDHKNCSFRFFSNIPDLKEINFTESSIELDNIFSKINLDTKMLSQYAQTRDIPSLEDGTSKVGVHLRFGLISIRKSVSIALEFSSVFLGELIWREFFQSILMNFPDSANHPFKKEYSLIKWVNNEAQLERWMLGTTGFPLVDAGMRELVQTGFMHNRVRMLVAGFLTKDLLIDWRIGEAFFAQHLLDYELASNVGNWQWAAGCGCDAAPYFRVFNPSTQITKFDPNYTYIKKWVPEFDTSKYPSQIVNHDSARIKAISVYREALESYRNRF